jgi:hypothetical protein
MRGIIKLIGALGVAGLAASQLVGYSSTTISGGTVNSVVYNLNAAGDNVDTVSLVLAGDTTAGTVYLGFNGGTKVSCGTGTFDTDHTNYACDANPAGAVNYVRSTSGLVSTAVVVN